MTKQASPILTRVRNAAAWVLGDEPAGDSTVNSEVNKAAKAYAKNLRSLGALAQSKDKKLKSRIEWFLLQPSTKVCGVITGARKRRIHLTWAQVLDTAASLNFWDGSGEPVRVDLTPKKSGGFRPIVKFGLKATALQAVLLDLLRATTKLPETEYAATGKGRNKAINLIVEKLNATGARHLVLADVQNFFPSITPEGLAGLTPLPNGVVVSALTVRECAVHLYLHKEPYVDDGVLKLIRAGIPQGSLTSPYLAAMVMGQLTTGLLSEEAGTTYVDDLAIVANSEEEGQAIKHALQERLGALPIGPYAFKRLEVVEIDGKSKIDFLGYRFRLGADGKVRVTPTPRAIKEFISKLPAKLRNVPYDEVMQVAVRAAEQWANVQDAWDLHEAAMDIFMVQVEQVAYAEMSRQASFFLNGNKVNKAISKLIKKLAMKASSSAIDEDAAPF